MAYIPSLKKLQYLVKLHQLQHFGRAAEACYVSQSTLSAGISDLEYKLDRLLIERTKHKMAFTAVGLELVEQAKSLLHDAGKFAETAEKFGQVFESTLRIGIIPTIAPYLLSSYLDTLSKHYPKLNFLVKEDITRTLQHQLLEGELDLLILALPYPAESVETMSLFNDSLKLIHCADSQFFDPKSVKSMKDFDDGSILMIEDGHCLRNHTLSTCHLYSTKQLNAFSTSSLASIVQMVKYDMGVSYIPDMAIENGILNDTNIQVHEGKLSEGVHREIGLAWRETSPFKSEFKEIGQHLLDVS